MTVGSILFWLLSWASVLGLTGFCFYRILTLRRHHDPDGTGPGKPPIQGAAGPMGAADGNDGQGQG